MRDVDSEKLLSYFLGNGFLNREEQDIENAVFITKNLLKIRGYPFAYNDFKSRGHRGVNSDEIRKVLLLKYDGNRIKMLKEYVHGKEVKDIVKTAEYLAKIDSERLGVTAQHLFNVNHGLDDKDHLYEWEARIAKSTLNSIEFNLEYILHPENEPKK